MQLKSSTSLLCAAVLLIGANPVSAKEMSMKKLMAMSAGCAYVTSVAEGSDVQLNYGSAAWLEIVGILEQKSGIDGENAIATAKAKYNKRARVMGADEAYKYMLSRAQDCDREMAVIQS